jgi:deoxyribose-phosphate aldolase
MKREDVVRRALPLIDLTSLNDDDTPEQIAVLCEQAKDAGVAAVCIYAPFVRQAKATGVRVATVVNFPAGAPDAAAAARDAKAAIADGADEIDVVLPYERYAAGDRDRALEVIRATREATTGAILKVILETGRIGGPETIHSAAADVLDLGADFVKTSTGKLQPGATLEAARPMLEAIRAAGHGGFKAAGGVRTAEDAGRYLELADEIMGEGWTSPQTFRFGASGLLADLLGKQAAGTY